MNNVTKLPASTRQRGREYLQKELAKTTTVKRARNYHRKLILILKEDANDPKTFTTYGDDLCMNIRFCANLEVEQFMRALISRIDELESREKESNE